MNSVHVSNIVHVTSPRRARTRQLKVDRITDTAIALVETGGLEALTVHQLAKELDWAVSGMYRYFPSKGALHAELQRRVIAEYHAELTAQLLELEEHGPLDRLIYTARHHQEYFLVRKGRLALIALSMSDPRQLLDAAESERVLEVVMLLLDDIAAFFDEARREKQLSAGSAFDRTQVYWATLQGILQIQKMTRFPGFMPTDRLLETSLRPLLLGWGADPRILSRALRRKYP